MDDINNDVTMIMFRLMLKWSPRVQESITWLVFIHVPYIHTYQRVQWVCCECKYYFTSHNLVLNYFETRRRRRERKKKRVSFFHTQNRRNYCGEFTGCVSASFQLHLQIWRSSLALFSHERWITHSVAQTPDSHFSQSLLTRANNGRVVFKSLKNDTLCLFLNKLD